MPPSAQAVVFVFTELWSPAQVEDLVCHFWPPGVSPSQLRALLDSPPFSYAPYHDHLVDIATNLVLAGHQRSLEQMLQELGFIPLHGPLPPIQVLLPLALCLVC